MLPLTGHEFALSQEGRISEAINSTGIVELFPHIILIWFTGVNIRKELLIVREYLSGERREGLLC